MTSDMQRLFVSCSSRNVPIGTKFAGLGVFLCTLFFVGLLLCARTYAPIADRSQAEARAHTVATAAAHTSAGEMRPTRVAACAATRPHILPGRLTVIPGASRAAPAAGSGHRCVAASQRNGQAIHEGQ